MLNRSERSRRKFTFKVREGRRAADFPIKVVPVS